MQVSELQSLSYIKWTIRAGDQNLRSRQLPEVRTIAGLLKISSLEGNDGLVLNATKIQNAMRYVLSIKGRLNCMLLENYKLCDR